MPDRAMEIQARSHTLSTQSLLLGGGLHSVTWHESLVCDLAWLSIALLCAAMDLYCVTGHRSALCTAIWIFNV